MKMKRIIVGVIIFLVFVLKLWGITETDRFYLVSGI